MDLASFVAAGPSPPSSPTSTPCNPARRVPTGRSRRSGRGPIEARPGITTEDHARPPPLRGRRPRPHGLAGHRGPEELRSRSRSPARTAHGLELRRHEELWLGHRDGPNERLRDPSLLPPPSAATTRPATPRDSRTRSSTLPRVYRAVEKAHAGRAPFPDLRGRAEEILLCDAIAESAEKGRGSRCRRLKLGTPPPRFRTLTLEQVRPGRPARARVARDRVLARGRGRERRYAGVTHIDVDCSTRRGPRCAHRHGLEISSLAYYPNNLHPDDEHRKEVNGHLLRWSTRRRSSEWRSSARSSATTRTGRDGEPRAVRAASGPISSATPANAASRSRSRTAR